MEVVAPRDSVALLSREALRASEMKRRFGPGPCCSIIVQHVRGVWLRFGEGKVEGDVDSEWAAEVKSSFCSLAERLVAAH